MHYNYYQTIPYEYDEFISGWFNSRNPSLSSLQEVILIYLQEMAYYILKLRELGAQNEVIKDNIINAILAIIANVDYNQEEFQKLMMILAQDLSQAKTLYANLCYKNNLEAKFLKTEFKHHKEFDIADIIKRGERYYVKKNTELTSEQKNLYDIMILLIKRICIKIIQLKSYDKDYETAYITILTLLNTMNTEKIKISEIRNVIEVCNSEYYKLLKTLYAIQEETYGEREVVNISFAPRTGKAILVSGIDMTQLDAVLKATRDREVDVYTHGMILLMAHTLPKFKEYPNLVGHFGRSTENSLFDFAAFPGAILMTRYLFQKVEYLYRGRLFTTDMFAPSGVIKIKDDDFEPLIQAAYQAKGFTKKEQEIILNVGFRQKFIEDKVQELIDKMEKNKIKHLYFIGILNYDSEYREYFDKFLRLMPKNCYAISLSS